MSFLFTAIKDYVYSGDALATDESATSKNASSSTSEQEEKEMRPPTANPYSSASTKNAERIIVAPPAPPTVTLSVPTFALDTGANSDSDSDSDDSDDDSDADVPKPSAQQTPQLNVAPYGPIATTTLLSAEDLEGMSSGTKAESIVRAHKLDVIFTHGPCAVNMSDLSLFNSSSPVLPVTPKYQ